MSDEQLVIEHLTSLTAKAVYEIMLSPRRCVNTPDRLWTEAEVNNRLLGVLHILGREMGEELAHTPANQELAQKTLDGITAAVQDARNIDLLNEDPSVPFNVKLGQRLLQNFYKQVDLFVRNAPDAPKRTSGKAAEKYQQALTKLFGELYGSINALRAIGWPHEGQLSAVSSTELGISSFESLRDVAVEALNRAIRSTAPSLGTDQSLPSFPDVPLIALDCAYELEALTLSKDPQDHGWFRVEQTTGTDHPEGTHAGRWQGRHSHRLSGHGHRGQHAGRFAAWERR